MEAMNEVLDPTVEGLLRLESGVMMSAHGRAAQIRVHGRLYLNCSDLPASRKVTGLAGHASELFMCHVCDSTILPSLIHAALLLRVSAFLAS